MNVLMLRERTAPFDRALRSFVRGSADIFQ